jgi:hypothetical protein
MPNISPTTYVVSVSSIPERDNLIKQIYTNLTKEPMLEFTIQQDQINRIRVFHNAGPDIRILIRTYLIIVIPIVFDLSPLHSLYGEVNFTLDSTITHLQTLMDSLQELQGWHTMRETTDVEAFKGLVTSLR